MMLGLYNITGGKSRIRKVQRRTVVGVSPKKDSSDEPVDYINLANICEKKKEKDRMVLYLSLFNILVYSPKNASKL